MSAGIPRLVHFDLKGGVPKLSYVLSLLPLMKQCGATGILMEYENVFPYWNQLSALAAPWAYTISEINELQFACEQLSLDLIPLVQTFGHAEFVLRHEEFQSLREHPDHPNCFCPSNNESLNTIDTMLTQILEAHPQISHFHIGCDEVAPVAVCVVCRERMQTTPCDKEAVFLEHVCAVSRRLKEHRPAIKVIIWDDMIRRISPGRLQESDIRHLVEPMVWYYGTESVPDVFGTYSEIFSRMWCASAFKGASGCVETLPNICAHIGNTKLWFSVIHDLTAKGVALAGIVLTGWSRYDYFGVLCELLPASLPSLVMCLRILVSQSGWTEDVHLEASRFLGIGECMSIDWQPRPKPVIANLRFPGDSVFVANQCQANLYRRFLDFLNHDLYRGWLHSYNLNRRFVNRATALELALEAQTLLREFTQLKDAMAPSMQEIFHPSVVEEWFGEHVDVYVTKLERVIGRIKRAIQP